VKITFIKLTCTKTTPSENEIPKWVAGIIMPFMEDSNIIWKNSLETVEKAEARKKREAKKKTD